jgi:hypothetical protein
MAGLRTNLDKAVEKFAIKTLVALDTTVQGTMAEMGFAAQALSPFYTGKFRASWRIAQNRTDTTTSAGARSKREASKLLRASKGRVDSGYRDVPVSSKEFSDLQDQAGSQLAGNVHILSNSVEYGDKVNSGDPETGRAPKLIVEQVRLLFPGFVAAAAQRARSKR